MASAGPVTVAGAGTTLTPLSEVPTPFVRIDGERLRANVSEMQERVSALGARLRPHFKTHRTDAIARLQLESGASGLTVATAAQLSHVVSELGCPVLVSSLVQADAAANAALREACASGAVSFAVDSVMTVERLRDAIGSDPSPEVMIEVDAGCGRTGVQPTDCADLARSATARGCRVTGVFSYPGHSYVPGHSEDASEQEQSALAAAARGLAQAGFEVQHVSAGSTPTMPFARGGVATEYRPGTYVFGDRQQLNLGSVARSQLSLSVVASVVAVQGDRIVLDAGGKALGRDAPRWLEGYGELFEQPDAMITRLYDHHAVIEGYAGPPVAVGDRLPILPNNANSVMALLRSAWLTERGEQATALHPHPDR
jgi:D-serine deaminase-like pyridoxal phosphate-dependent protein